MFIMDDPHHLVAFDLTDRHAVIAFAVDICNPATAVAAS